MEYGLTDQVGSHEGEGQLIVVLVVDLPDGVLLEVGVLPEPGEGLLAGLLVGVLSLPLVQIEGGAGKLSEGVLRLGGRLVLLLLLLGCRLGGSLGLLLLGLLLGCSLGGNVLDGLVDEVELSSDLSVAGDVVDGLVPTGDVGVLRSPCLVEEVLEAAGEDAGSEDIGKSQTLADEIGVCKKVLLEDLDGLEGGSSRVINVLLVVGVAAENGAEPATERGEDLGVGEGHPSQDGGVVLLGLSQKCGLLVLRGHCGKCQSESPRMLYNQ